MDGYKYNMKGENYNVMDTIYWNTDPSQDQDPGYHDK